MIAHALKIPRVVLFDILGVFNPAGCNKTAVIPGSAFYSSPAAFINKFENDTQKHVIDFSDIDEDDLIAEMDAVNAFIESMCKKDNKQTAIICDESVDIIPESGTYSKKFRRNVKNGRNWHIRPAIMTTQRPQEISKKGLEHSDGYFIFKQLGENTLERLADITNAEDRNATKTRLRNLEKRHVLFVHGNVIQEYVIPNYNYAFAQH